MNTVEVDLETLERALDGDRLAAANLLASLPWWAVPEARANRSRALDHLGRTYTGRMLG